VPRSPKTNPRPPTSIRFSKRDVWYIQALVDRGGYGDTATDVVRGFLWEGIRKARQIGDLPSPSLPPASEIPGPDEDDDDAP
jgi:hypothetical protein